MAKKIRVTKNADSKRRAKPAGYRYLVGKNKDNKAYYARPTAEEIAKYEAGDKRMREMIYFEGRTDHSDSSQVKKFKKGATIDTGNILIKGTDLTDDQKSMLKFRGMENPQFVKNHSFYFKSGKPSTEEGFYYPVGHSFSHLKYSEGGGIDLFENYDEIPENVQAILDKHSEAFEDGDYKGLEKALAEIEKTGYTFEYYLDGQAFDLRPIGTKGKSENEGEFKKGGDVKNADNKRKAKPEGYRYRLGKNKNNPLYYKRPTAEEIASYEAGDKSAREMIYYEGRRDHSDSSQVKKFRKGGSLGTVFTKDGMEVEKGTNKYNHHTFFDEEGTGYECLGYFPELDDCKYRNLKTDVEVVGCMDGFYYYNPTKSHPLLPDALKMTDEAVVKDILAGNGHVTTTMLESITGKKYGALQYETKVGKLELKRAFLTNRWKKEKE